MYKNVLKQHDIKKKHLFKQCLINVKMLLLIYTICNRHLRM